MRALLDADARIHWIPSTVTDELANLARGGKIEWLPRACRSADRAALHALPQCEI